MNLPIVLSSLCLGLIACAPQVCRCPESPPDATPKPCPDAPRAPAQPPWVGVKGPSGGAIGTPHQVLVRATAPDGRWLVMCQARKDTDGDGSIGISFGHHGEIFGDELVGYLVGTDLRERVTEDLVAHDPTGRWLVVISQQKLVLIDTLAGREEVLVGRGGFVPQASFDERGERLLYVRLAGKERQAVVRFLPGGAEQPVPHGKGRLLRAFLGPRGRRATLQVVAKDTNGDGRLSYPVVRTNLVISSPCRGRPKSSYTMGFSGDRPVTRFASIERGGYEESEDYVAVWHDALVRVGSAGELARYQDRRFYELVPASCGGRLLAGDRASGTLLAACTKHGDPSPLFLFRRGWSQELPLAVPRPSEHARWLEEPVFTDVSTAEGRRLVNLRSGHVTALDGNDREHARFGRMRLYSVRSEAAVLDTANGKVTPVPLPVRTYGRVAWQGPLVAVDGPARLRPVVDLRRGEMVGCIDRIPLAITEHGHVLVEDDSPSVRIMGHHFGPVRWITPRTSCSPSSG